MQILIESNVLNDNLQFDGDCACQLDCTNDNPSSPCQENGFY